MPTLGQMPKKMHLMTMLINYRTPLNIVFLYFVSLFSGEQGEREGGRQKERKRERINKDYFVKLWLNPAFRSISLGSSFLINVMGSVTIILLYSFRQYLQICLLSIEECGSAALKPKVLQAHPYVKAVSSMITLSALSSCHSHRTSQTLFKLLGGNGEE